MYTRARHVVEALIRVEIDTARRVPVEDVIDGMTVYLKGNSNTTGGIIRSFRVIDIKDIKSESTEVPKDVRNS